MHASKMRTPKLHGQQGFTVPELISVMIVTSIFSGLLVFFAFNFWRGTATLANDSDTFVTRLNASDVLRDLIGESSGLISQNSIADPNTGNADPTNASGQFWLPIHAVPGAISVGTGNAITPVLYFRQPAVDTSKNFAMNGQQPYENEYVLYMDASTKQLRLRTLANGNVISSRATTSCPPAAVTGACPADRLLAESVSSVTLRYFSRSGNLIDYHSIVDPTTGAYIGPDFPSVEVVEISLQLFKKSQLNGGQDTANQTVIRIALRNS
jgi:Tfp pilus assembly protein FimT